MMSTSGVWRHKGHGRRKGLLTESLCGEQLPVWSCQLRMWNRFGWGCGLANVFGATHVTSAKCLDGLASGRPCRMARSRLTSGSCLAGQFGWPAAFACQCIHLLLRGLRRLACSVTAEPVQVTRVPE